MTLLSPRCHCWRTFATYISAKSELYSQTRRPISWDLWNNLNLVTISRFNDRFSFGSISREFCLQNSYWALFSIRLQVGYKKTMFLLCLTFLVGWTGLNLCGSCVVFLSWDSTSVYSEKKGGRREIFLLTSIVPNNSNVCRGKIW